MNGIINIKKEKGYTSHDVVAIVRKVLNTKKVGHTGTLDPDAEGVLPVCVGRGTKVADYIMAAKKQYFAEVTLGTTTTTQDSSGEVIKEREVVFDQDKIKEVVNSFVGELNQIPPMYSAIKIDGKKLYELAREGKEVERKSRQITIYDIEIKSMTPPNKFEILVTCSKGTYIRTLCNDIGEALGCGAHMSKLIRTQSGSFNIDEAITLDELRDIASKGNVETILKPLDKALEDYNKIRVSKKADKLIYNGCKIYEPYFEFSKNPYTVGQKVIAFDSKDDLVGIFEVREEGQTYIKPIKILFN